MFKIFLSLRLPILSVIPNVLSMPRFYSNIYFSDCWSSVGSVTFYHIGNKCYFRKRAFSVWKGSTDQVLQSAVHTRALKAWKGLDHQIQKQWNEYAKDVPASRPPYNDSNHISGYNLFVSAYHNFFQLGDEHVPVPVKYNPFPVTDLEFVLSEIVDNSHLHVTFKLHLDGVQYSSRYRVLGKIMLSDAGRGCKTGLLRNYLSAEVGYSDDGCQLVQFQISDFKQKFPLNGLFCKFHMRYVLIDSISGYRNLQKRLSIEI